MVGYLVVACYAGETQSTHLVTALIVFEAK